MVQLGPVVAPMFAAVALHTRMCAANDEQLMPKFIADMYDNLKTRLRTGTVPATDHGPPINNLDDKVHNPATQGAATDDDLVNKFLRDKYGMRHGRDRDRDWFDGQMAAANISEFSQPPFQIIGKNGIALSHPFRDARHLIVTCRVAYQDIRKAIQDKEAFLIIPTKVRAGELVKDLALKNKESVGVFSALWEGKGIQTAKADELNVLENDCGSKAQGSPDHFAKAYKLQYTKDGLTLTKSKEVLQAFFYIVSIDPTGFGDEPATRALVQLHKAPLS